MNNSPEFSIVIPAYNESDKIITSLNKIVTFMKTFNESYEILVSNDGSTDNTVDIINNYIVDHPEVKLIDNIHKGKGPTVWSGMMSAEGNYIYMADADLSTPIDELKKMHTWAIEHNYDVVIASREGLGASRINEPFYRHLMGRIFNLLVQTTVLPGIKDSQCGFKLFSKKSAKDIFPRLRIYGKEAVPVKKGYMGAFDVEVLYLSRRLGYKVKEISVPWTYVKTTRLNPLRDSILMALDVLKIRLNDLQGLYRIQ